MYRQFDWFRYSHPCSVPGNGDPELHDSPAAEFQQIRFLQRPKGSHVRSESRVCSSGRAGCSGRFGDFRAELGQQISQDRKVVAGKLGQPQHVRHLIYTTNTIEGFNRQLRKVTKSKSVFPTDDSLLKILYLAMMDITKKWTGRRQDWSRIHAQLSIYFAERMPD